jgi:catecholate siderophore receptor
MYYDKFYQNVYPGAVDTSGTQVSLLGYNNATERRNLFNQTDVSGTLAPGTVRHTLLAGAELSRQRTDNFRNTAYFRRQRDGDEHAGALRRAHQPRERRLPSVFDGCGQSRAGGRRCAVRAGSDRALVAVAGHRRRARRRVHDPLPQQPQRAGARALRPARLPARGADLQARRSASLYASYSVSHLPSSGDQFSSLTATTQTLEPERFRNYELGAKWDVRESLALTGALFQLDRSNSTAPDPANPERTVQTGAQRTTGYELGATGEVTSAWQLVAGYSSQIARIRSRTATGAEGATVPLVPRSTLSLWNRVQLAPAVAVGAGAVHQARMYAAIDNSVTLPASPVSTAHCS